MPITDPVADMLPRIRNANNAKHETVDVPASNMKKSIAQILLDEGYIKAFQIVDDALDFAPQSVTGKPSGGDVREGKLTPPLRMYRDSLDDAARAAFDQAFNDASFTDSDAERIADGIRAAGFDQATRMAAEGYLDKARAALATLPSGPEQDILQQMADYVRDRKK